MKTLLLDRSAWDLVIDASGNIAVASDPYSIAQDVCSALRLFLGELWYKTDAGVPYLERILGKAPNLELLKQYLTAAARTVPQVVEAQCFISRFVNREVSGQIQFKYTVSADTGEVTTLIGTIAFVGDNTGVVSFIGDNGISLNYTGQVIG